MALDVIIADFDKYKVYLGAGLVFIILTIGGVIKYRRYIKEKRKKIGLFLSYKVFKNK
ncbi:MAG: hypothetical protein H6925_00760 [Holosporaceae bacterium]|nr:MAG: hypothetical protein H6925_00760 [Holosporaceae bacterium]